MADKFTKEQVDKFKTVMADLQKTTYMVSFEASAFILFCYYNGFKNSEVYEKAYVDFAAFAKYLSSAGIGVASTMGAEEKPFNFMFLDDAKELGATITEE